MKKPSNVNELKELIKSMRHRERFVFDSVSGGTLEVYYTLLFESRNCDENILFISIDKNGDQTKKSKLLKLFTNDFWERLYKMIQ
jgi:hypothetical protein